MSEKRKSSDSPRTTKSKVKLKTKRTSSTEENAGDNGETTSNFIHSTPTRESNINEEDVLETSSLDSPIACTQKNEICWSWHSPKAENTKKNDLKTPKRSKLYKRHKSDVPKMHAMWGVPVKAKVTSYQAEFIANFEPFRARLNKKLEPVPSTSDKSTTINETTTTSSIVDKKQNPETTDESKLKLDCPDDHDLDESLVRCSQICEEEFFAKIANEQKISTSTPLMTIQEKGSHINNSPISGLENLIKVPIETPRKSVAQVTPKNKLISFADDSFDEYLSQLRDEDLLKIDTPHSRKQSRINSSVPKKSLFPANNNPTKLGVVKSCSILDTNKSAPSEKSFPKTKSFDLQSKIYPSASNTSVFQQQQQKRPQNLQQNPQKQYQQKTQQIYQQQQRQQQQQQQQQQKPPIVVKQPESSPRKFFKSKCNSEPLAKSPKFSSIPAKKSSDVQVPNFPSSSAKTIGKSFQCKTYLDSCNSQGTGSNSSSSSGSSKLSQSENRAINGINHNNSINNVCNNFPNNPLSTHRFMAGHHIQSRQVVLFTEEQIEKKRIEAKMKLEAKRRLLNAKAQRTTTTTTTTRILPIKSSVKR